MNQPILLTLLLLFFYNFFMTQPILLTCLPALFLIFFMTQLPCSPHSLHPLYFFPKHPLISLSSSIPRSYFPVPIIFFHTNRSPFTCIPYPRANPSRQPYPGTSRTPVPLRQSPRTSRTPASLPQATIPPCPLPFPGNVPAGRHRACHSRHHSARPETGRPSVPEPCRP